MVAVGGVDAVVAGRDGELSADNVDERCLQPLIGRIDGDRSGVLCVAHPGVDALGRGRRGVRRRLLPGRSLLLNSGVGLTTTGRDRQGRVLHGDVRDRGDGVVGGGQGDARLSQGDEALRLIIALTGLQSVTAGLHRQRPGLNHQVVLAAQAVVGGFDGDGGVPGDDEAVLGGDAVLVGAGHVQLAGPGDGERVGGEQGRGGLLTRGVARSVGQRVLGVLGQDHDRVSGVLDVDGRAVRARDARAVEDQAHIVLGGVDDDPPVAELAAEDVGAAAADGDGAPVDLHVARCRPTGRSRRSRQRDRGGRRRVRGSGVVRRARGVLH